MRFGEADVRQLDFPFLVDCLLKKLDGLKYFLVFHSIIVVYDVFYIS